jgi:hypothetical protein
MKCWAALDHGDARRAQEVTAMLQRTGLCLLVGVLGAVPACGSPSDNDFSGPALGGSGKTGGASGSAGSAATSGDSGTAGKGGSSSGAGGLSTGGSDVGGTGTGGATQGGSSGDTAMGGTGMAAGGTDAGAGGTDAGTGGTEPGTGGTEPATGGTGGMLGAGMGGKGGKGGRGGAGGQTSCDELAQQYVDALAAARACNAKSGKEQCTELASSSLTCGCDDPVNPDNIEAVAELRRLRKAGASCSMVCPAIACIPPEGAECAPDDASPGLCRSVGAILE